MDPISEHLDRLRAPLPVDDSADQLLYEKWLKLDRWRARAHGLPLLVGCDPEAWIAHLETHGLAASEELVWQLMSNDLGVDEEQAVEVSRLVAWAGTHGMRLPQSFARIHEFVRKVLLDGGAAPDAADGRDAVPGGGAAHVENEIVLGAALSLVSKMPDRCRDENGFIDGTVLARLIMETASRWFPPQGPALSAEQMAALLDRWLE